MKNECTVLGIDPGRVSGWAVRDAGMPTWIAGEAKTQAERVEAVERAQAHARFCGHALVVVAEKWTAHGAFGGARTQRGLGQAWGLWMAALETAWHPKRRVVRVYPATWRARVLGMGGRGATTEACRAAAWRVAEEIGVDHGGSEDACEAACIVLWGLGHSEEVAALVPKRRKAA